MAENAIIVVVGFIVILAILLIGGVLAKIFNWE